MKPTIARVEQDLSDLDRSLNTKKTYIQDLKRLHNHCGKPLDELGSEDVRDYLRSLIRSPNHSFATYRAFIAAARFCYNVTLSRHEVVTAIRCPRAPKKLPVVLT